MWGLRPAHEAPRTEGRAPLSASRHAYRLAYNESRLDRHKVLWLWRRVPLEKEPRTARPAPRAPRRPSPQLHAALAHWGLRHALVHFRAWRRAHRLEILSRSSERTTTLARGWRRLRAGTAAVAALLTLSGLGGAQAKRSAARRAVAALHAHAAARGRARRCLALAAGHVGLHAFLFWRHAARASALARRRLRAAAQLWRGTRVEWGWRVWLGRAARGAEYRRKVWTSAALTLLLTLTPVPPRPKILTRSLSLTRLTCWRRATRA